MTPTLADAGEIDALTAEQYIAAATSRQRIFIEAGPGTGKTTVSAQRFGVHRFSSERRHDPRAVVAVSFTRAATRNLRHRVQRLWGPAALMWPHRIVTLDTIVCDLVHDLLRAQLVEWPNAKTLWPDGNIVLDVHDSWASCANTEFTRSTYTLSLSDRRIQLHRKLSPKRANRVLPSVVESCLKQGVCTHQDVRDILELSLNDPAAARRVRQRLAYTVRSLIVDEVFDANDLDIAIIELAITADIAVTLVGDPWQALYLFRGAKPHIVPSLLQRAGVPTLPLVQSFRWRADEQRMLAEKLREGHGVLLPNDPEEPDVVLGLWWKELWEVGGRVLPLAFHSFKGGYEESAATLLLNHITRSIFDLDATYLNDALTALGIGLDSFSQLDSGFQEVVEVLRPGGKGAVDTAYLRLVEVIGAVSQRPLRGKHHAHTKRLAQLQKRIAFPGRPVPGLTTHQAKGSEWDVVGVRLTDVEREALRRGLSSAEDMHRKIYVACTRARRRTVEVIGSE
ncbi:UvrD-helicase domain-containing protein [Nocardia gipuzkoensis]|uniref:UvrD-helicase domain-containing protein n=1 Tax=Nocardia gipuzkoensis TaxID=2749991 RepID=UPI00237E2D54|nr:UvrD-helicase domain-containing protein [Nocardia gipuzkoensis]MDE1671753.1 UvrD-helicase domain-containing protein [Nocardia gipuzkoensis]